jgi:metal-dependent HD superfamily phosphatase/phosphodiesterase
VTIQKGVEKPIRIIVEMSAEVGFFQIEEVLLPKVNSSPVKPFVELLAGVVGQEKKQYL